MSRFILTENNFDDIYHLPEDITEIQFNEILFNIDTINKITNQIKDKNIKLILITPIEEISTETLDKLKNQELIVFHSGYTKEEYKSEITVNQMKVVSNILDLFVHDIKNSELSPYEKYVAVYYLVKNFKSYRFLNDSSFEDHRFPEESRSIYLTLFNEWMVCSGYTGLLYSLLKRVDIKSKQVSVAYDGQKHAHSRLLVEIKDPKYKIDGVYLCDPTMDVSDTKNSKDFYRLADHLNISADENPLFSEKESITTSVFELKTDEEFASNIIEYLEYLRTFRPEFYTIYRTRIQSPQMISTLNSAVKESFGETIPLKKRYQALMSVKQFIEGVKYTEEEYEQQWDDMVAKDFKFDLLRGSWKPVTNFDNNFNKPDKKNNDYDYDIDNRKTLN